MEPWFEPTSAQPQSETSWPHGLKKSKLGAEVIFREILYNMQSILFCACGAQTVEPQWKTFLPEITKLGSNGDGKPILPDVKALDLNPYTPRFYTGDSTIHRLFGGRKRSTAASTDPPECQRGLSSMLRVPLTWPASFLSLFFYTIEYLVYAALFSQIVSKVRYCSGGPVLCFPIN